MLVVFAAVELLGISPEIHGLVKNGPQVAIIMGSDSDLPCMKEAAIVLEKFKVGLYNP